MTGIGGLGILVLGLVVGKLRHTSVELEQRVEERTSALARANEALASSNAELEQFAYIASHDLQEPLRKIASCCKILEDDYADKLDDEGREWIHFAVDGAFRMRGLIRDLLAFSRVARRESPLEQVNAESVCQRAVLNLEESIEETAAQITCQHLPEVTADVTQLGQLFQNLIGNAIKYRADRIPEVEIGAESVGQFWQFYVKDNGIGIAPEYSERVFVIFQRLHTKEEYSGTGIGLSICKKIVEGAGGKIWIESIPGEGSTFFFTWPKQEEAQDEPIREPVLSAD